MDIAMCQRDDCPRARECYRYTAAPNGLWQSYIEPEAIGEQCEHYWPIGHRQLRERHGPHGQ